MAEKRRAKLPTSLSPRQLLRCLEDLANSGDTAADAEYFAKLHPGFLDVIVEEPTFPQENPLTICKDSLYTFKVGRAMVRASWEGQVGVLEKMLLHQLDSKQKNLNIARVDWQKGDFTYHAKSLLQAAAYELLKHSRFAKICASPGCGYHFIAAKTQTRYCSQECGRLGFRAAQIRHYEQKIKPRREKNRKLRELVTKSGSRQTSSSVKRLRLNHGKVLVQRADRQ